MFSFLHYAISFSVTYVNELSSNWLILDVIARKELSSQSNCAKIYNN